MHQFFKATRQIYKAPGLDQVQYTQLKHKQQRVTGCLRITFKLYFKNTIVTLNSNYDLCFMNVVMILNYVYAMKTISSSINMHHLLIWC